MTPHQRVAGQEIPAGRAFPGKQAIPFAPHSTFEAAEDRGPGGAPR
jgi:hypothetical protein